MYYLLFYKTIDTYMEERGKYRSEHLKLATEALNRGELMLAGAFDNPPDGAVLAFKGESEKVAITFAENDPYVKNGLIKEWHVRKWNVVVGNDVTPITAT